MSKIPLSNPKIKFELDVDCIKIIESNLQLIKKDRESLSKVENNECIHDFFDGHQGTRSPGTSIFIIFLDNQKKQDSMEIQMHFLVAKEIH